MTFTEPPSETADPLIVILEFCNFAFVTEPSAIPDEPALTQPDPSQAYMPTCSAVPVFK